jgi:hypothetical protein
VVPPHVVLLSQATAAEGSQVTLHSAAAPISLEARHVLEPGSRVLHQGVAFYRLPVSNAHGHLSNFRNISATRYRATLTRHCHPRAGRVFKTGSMSRNCKTHCTVRLHVLHSPFMRRPMRIARRILR